MGWERRARHGGCLLVVTALCACTPADRSAAPAPPLVDVPIVFVSRAPQADGSAAWPTARGGPLDMPGVGPRSRVRPAPGGRLLVREPDGRLRTLVDGARPSADSLDLVDVNGPSVSYDGEWIVFAGLRDAPAAAHDPAHGTPAAGGWRLYTIRADGSGLRQLTFDDPARRPEDFVARFGPEAGPALLPFDDFDPVFLPTGNVAFASTRWPSFAHVGDQRASQIYVVDADGSGLRRITSERNGADRPVVDPVSGELVFARWWTNARYPTNSTASVAAGAGWQVRHGLKATAPPLPGEDAAYAGLSMARASWHAAHIRPDGYGLGLFAGWMRSDDDTHFYGGSFSDDGALYANYFPAVDMTAAAGFGGVRRVARGASRPAPVAGVAGPREDFVSADVDGRGTPSRGVFRSRYAADAVVLPNPADGGRRTGRLVLSMTREPGDLKQDYGLYVADADGARAEPLLDLPGTAELRAQVLAPRAKPDVLIDVATSDGLPLPPPDVPADPAPEDLAKVAANGDFTYHALNVYANAEVDVGIVSAPPVGSAATLQNFADYQRRRRGSDPARDWPILLAEAKVDAGGAVRLAAPANLPLFEVLRDAGGRVAATGGRAGAATRDQGTAFVAGMNYAPPGFHSRCVGCHAGHSLIEVPESDDEAKWTNLAPGARVTATPGEAAAEALVDRRARTAETTWRAAGPARARLTFPVPVWVREVRLHPPVDGAVVTLFGDEAATRAVARGAPTSFAGAPLSGGQADGVRVVQVDVDALPPGGLAEIEVVARGDAPPSGRIDPAPPPVAAADYPPNPSDHPVADPAEASAAAMNASRALAESATPGPDGQGRSGLAACAGAAEITFGSGRPLPWAEGVERASVRLGEEGALRLDPAMPEGMPIYQVTLRCAAPPCAWTTLSLDRALPSRADLQVRVRAGDTPVPDETWGPWTESVSAARVVLNPPLRGAYVQLDFSLIAANAARGPALWGFRLCHGDAATAGR